MEVVGSHDYRCTHPWEPSLELPRGNPFSGSAQWDKSWPDIGTYDNADMPGLLVVTAGDGA